MKKRYLLIVLAMIGHSALQAQQYPLYTQYVFNNFGINPAFAGSENCIDLRAGYRMQWAGFEGNPGTAFINGHGKIKPKLLNTREWFMGVGGRIISDEAGPFTFIRLELAWSIHVKLGRSLYGAFGVFAGMTQSRFSLSGLTFSDPNNDPIALGGSQVSILAPTITPGLLLYGKTFFIDLSIQDVVPKKMPDVGTETNLSTHFVMKGAKSFKLTRRSDLIPSINLRWVSGAPVAYEINMMYSLDNRYQIGVAYRNNTAVAGLLRLRLFGSFTVAYAYDYIINNLKYGTSGSHEIMIGFNTCDLGKGKNIRCAAFN